MTILKMTATFGKLSRQTLTLNPNLNVFTLPNESGKTTWTQFLLAMFYGVDTSERSTKDTIAVKKQYKPWSGEGMSGVIELLHEGRRITIERSAHGAVPFGTFRAYDTETGQDIPELTAENCGEVLLGCEKSVFTRSALLQGNLAVTSDDALNRRLSSLVASGSETISYSQTYALLHKTANRIKNTLLPQTQKALSETDAALAQIRAQHRQDLDSETQRLSCAQQLAHYNAILEGFAYQKAVQRRKRQTEAQQALRQAEAALAEQEKKTASLPGTDILLALKESLSEKPSALQLPPEVDAPAVFSGLSAENAVALSQADAAEYDRLTEAKRKPIAIFLILAGVFFALSVAGILLLHTLYGLCLLAGTATCAILAIRAQMHNRKQIQNEAVAGAILEKYHCTARDEILTAGAAYAAAKSAYDAQLAQYQAGVLAEKERMARLLGQVSMFCPDCRDAQQALQAVTDALGAYAALDRARQEVVLCQKQCELLQAALGSEVLAQAPQVDLTGWTEQAVLDAKADAEQRLSSLQMQLARSAGAVEALGDPAELCAQKEQLDARAEQLAAQQQAFLLAEKTLQAANAELQTRFSPKLCLLAGSYLQTLTDNRYDALTLDASMKTTARESGGALTRELLYLSSGTGDQVYFALRLAIAALALPEDTPIILDDALIRFDDNRLRAALRLLQQQSKTRQILLFSCHSREKTILEGEGV